MKMPRSRRDFLKFSTRSTLVLAGASLIPAVRTKAVEPIHRPGKARLQLSLAAYSFRDYFNHADAAKRITLQNFVDYCADQGCAGTELTSYYFPKGFTNDFLLTIKRHAFLRGVAISGSAVGNNFALPKGPKRDAEIAHVKTWVDHCAVLGAPHIRVFAGSASDNDVASAKRLCIEALEECGEYAGRRGIFLGLENHGGIVAEPKDLLEIVRAVQNPWVGVNLDTGNFHTDDPYAGLAQCAPHAVNVQVKVEIKRRGQAAAEPADLARLVRILRDSNYQGFVALEYEARPDPWQAVPEWLAKLKAALAA
jgi:sugar phosphate isomerase/epimerase